MNKHFVIVGRKAQDGKWVELARIRPQTTAVSGHFLIWKWTDNIATKEQFEAARAEAVTMAKAVFHGLHSADFQDVCVLTSQATFDGDGDYNRCIWQNDRWIDYHFPWD